jgi:tetratricopeptide (TPR) repeat protein
MIHQAVRSRMLAGALLLGLIMASGGARAATAPLDPVSLADAREGLSHLYHGRTVEAAACFERIRERLPAHPAADFLLGGIEWHRLTTGPQGFVGGGTAEVAFFARMDAAIALGEEALARDPDDISAAFFVGGAYGYKARYLALREKWWDAYRSGRKGVKHLEHVVEKDPELADAYLGLGIYHYYADVLPAVLKFFAGFIGLKGDRERGLEEIHHSLREGSLVDGEARFFLAEIYTTFEEDHWTALGYSRSLRDEYPENELFVWLNARILDELHLTELATAEWKWLHARAEAAHLRGFLEYRLARTQLFAGDFAGAAATLESHLATRRGFGSPRITMWGHLRLGMALDFLGRHEEAMAQYRAAKELDASDSASERARERLAAGRKDPSVVSLLELRETTRIVKETRAQDEDALLRCESLATRPSRGLNKTQASLFADILTDLAQARLRRGDPRSCLEAADRFLALDVRLPKEERAKLRRVRAHALVRLGHEREALAELRTASGEADWLLKQRIDRERELIASRLPESPASAAPEAARFVFRAPDRGELIVEVEGDFLPANERLPLTLVNGEWRGAWAGDDRQRIRYRFVIDGTERRIDPYAPHTILSGDETWSERELADEIEARSQRGADSADVAERP